jgi:RNA polymerase sigma-70 factor (ECF subfamily)
LERLRIQRRRGIEPARDHPEPEDDRALVRRAQQGEREAFATLVRRHQDRAFNLAYQMVRHREDALDVAQEAFARAYTSLPSFKGDATFGTWLHRIVVNLAIDSLRRRRRGGETPYDDWRGLPEEPDGELTAPDDPGMALEAKQTRALLARGIAELPPAQRAALILREVEGLSYEEIARAVGCSPGTVMSRLFYGRRRLRQVLKARLADLR